MKRPAKKPTAVGINKLRITAGTWRGRLLTFADVPGLRPTGSRIRETLFNWLAVDLPGSCCLDVFAGSGILGLEALSRGAAECVLIERQLPALRQLQGNIKQLAATAATVVHGDALQWLQAAPCRRFDLVFVDPPFADNLWHLVAEGLERGWLAERAWIYVETPLQCDFAPPTHWRLHRQKTAGQVRYSLYERLSDTVTGAGATDPGLSR